jgi:polysaccharide export outer membrane protein
MARFLWFAGNGTRAKVRPSQFFHIPRRTMQRFFSILCVFLLAHALVGCHGFKPPPTFPHEDPDYGAAHGGLTGLDSDPPMPLVLLPGDTITVRSTSNESTVYEGLIIDSEGKVHVPIIGAAQIAGLAPQQAERTIEGMMQKIDRFVRISVLVTEWGGHFATVIGAVVEEGAKTLSPGMRVAELVAASGGPLRTTEGEINYVADLDSARLMREGKQVPISLRLALLGDPRHNVFVRAGDQLFVPAGLGNRIAVLGNDARTGAMINYRPGMRLTEALASGGGLNLSSDAEDIRIIRGPLKKPIVYLYDMEALIAGDIGDVELAPGDVVFVTRHWSAAVAEVLDKVAPLVGIALAGLSTGLLVKQFQLQKQLARDQRNFLEEQLRQTQQTP